MMIQEQPNQSSAPVEQQLKEFARWQMHVDTTDQKPSDTGINPEDVAYSMWLEENAKNPGSTSSKLGESSRSNEDGARKERLRSMARLGMRVKTGTATGEEAAQYYGMMDLESEEESPEVATTPQREDVIEIPSWINGDAEEVTQEDESEKNQATALQEDGTLVEGAEVDEADDRRDNLKNTYEVENSPEKLTYDLFERSISGHEKVLMLGLNPRETRYENPKKPNEDHTYSNPDTKVFVVADGMGGHNAGDTASDIAANVVGSYLSECEGLVGMEGFSEALQIADEKIEEEQIDDPHNKSGMGTTVIAAKLTDNLLEYINAGDSGLILVRDGFVYRLTTEQGVNNTVFNVLHGGGRPAVIEGKDMRHDEYGILDLDKNDTVILVSDGILGDWDDERITDDEIRSVVEAAQGNPEKIVDGLFKASKKVDDTTAIAITVH